MGAMFDAANPANPGTEDVYSQFVIHDSHRVWHPSARPASAFLQLDFHNQLATPPD